MNCEHSVKGKVRDAVNHYTLPRDQPAESEEVNFFLATRNRIYYFANFLRLRRYQHTKNIEHLKLLDHGRVFLKVIL